MLDLNPVTAMIVLEVSELNISPKRQRLLEWIIKVWLNCMLSLRNVDIKTKSITKTAIFKIMKNQFTKRK